MSGGGHGLATAARRVLEANWREGLRSDGVPYAYTCPATPRYRHQWYWDSCFHAIVWTHFEPARARAELRTLVRTMTREGLVPHTSFWGAPAGWRRTPLYATARFRGSVATATTGPPLLALAWERVAQASQAEDPGFASEALERLRAHSDWLVRERDPDGDGLLSILLPDESGLDDSPKYDPVYGRCTHDRPGYFRLVEACRRRGWDSRAIMAAGDRHVEDVLFNVAFVLSERALHRLSGDAEHERRAERCEAALLERCLDPATGLFFDLAGRGERRVRISTWSALAPLALGDAIPEGVRRRLVEAHLLHPRRYGAACGIPSVSMEEPAFNPTWDRFRVWRGPSWAATAWLLVPGLDALGYGEAADRIVDGLMAAAARDGLREYYHPLTGAGLGARDFGFATLLHDLAACRSPARGVVSAP